MNSVIIEIFGDDDDDAAWVAYRKRDNQASRMNAEEREL